MWSMILSIFERHTILNQLTAPRNFYTVTIQSGEKVWSNVNGVGQLAGTLQSMAVEIYNKVMAVAVLN